MFLLILILGGVLGGGLFFLIYASASIRSGVYLKAACRLKTDEKIIALTFDDGPDGIITPKILDVLSDYKVPAVFFCIGHKTKGQECLLRRIVNEGHGLGNHSYSHSASFPLWSRARIKEDILRCEDCMSYITLRRSFFRPPFGVTNPTVARAVALLGHQTMGWNVRSFDTVKKKLSECRKTDN